MTQPEDLSEAEIARVFATWPLDGVVGRLLSEVKRRRAEEVAHPDEMQLRCIDAETELEAISDVATGARPASDFDPASGTLGDVLKVLALRRPLERLIEVAQRQWDEKPAKASDLNRINEARAALKDLQSTKEEAHGAAGQAVRENAEGEGRAGRGRLSAGVQHGGGCDHGGRGADNGRGIQDRQDDGHAPQDGDGGRRAVAFRAGVASQQGAAPAQAREHELKCWPEHFEKLLSGDKGFELRLNDRDFKTGDVLYQREWSRGYTGREVRHRVSYILDGGSFGLAQGHVAMSLAPLAPTPEHISGWLAGREAAAQEAMVYFGTEAEDRIRALVPPSGPSAQPLTPPEGEK